MKYLALCCIAKDEDPFLKEWLAYHALLGVEHFYIYDNMSARPIRETLGDFADPDRVTIRRIQGSRMQFAAYDDCLATDGPQCRWIAFIDLDEFILPMRDGDLRPLLAEFEEYAGLALTWHLFGPSGHLSRPEGPVIKNYTQAFRDQTSYHMKCIVQPALTLASQNPHNFIFAPGRYAVNEDHLPVTQLAQKTPALGRLARVNHYFTRSQQDFEEKLARGRADAEGPGDAHELIMYYQSAAKPWVEDTLALRLLPALEKALAQNRLPRPAPRLAPEASFEEVMEAALGFMESGFPEKAAICLCGGPEHEERADFWTLRSMAALQSGHPGRAEIFIRQAIRREGTGAAYRQLAVTLRAMGKTEQAAGVENYLNTYPELLS